MKYFKGREGKRVRDIEPETDKQGKGKRRRSRGRCEGRSPKSNKPLNSKKTD